MSFSAPQRADDVVVSEWEAEPGKRLRIQAGVLRQERTGVHGLLELYCEDVCLKSGYLNLWRDEDRNRLANAAYKLFGKGLAVNRNGTDTHYTEVHYQHAVMEFCRRAWDAWTTGDAPEDTPGLAAPAPLRWVLPGLLLEEGGTLQFAAPGKGKSYLTMLQAVGIDAADAIPEDKRLWAVARPRKVLFINLERGRHSVMNRLGNINRVLGLDPTRPLRMLHRRGHTLADVAGAVARDIKEHGIEVLVLDSISRAGTGSLTEDAPVRQICDLLSNLCPTWLAIAHSPRGDDTHAFGSMHFDAAADLMVKVTSQQETGGPLGIQASVEKTNDAPKSKTPIWALEFDGELGLKDIRLARPGEFPEIEEGMGTNLRSRVRAYLADTNGASATQIARELHVRREEVSRLLSGSQEFYFAGKQGRESVYRACAPGYIRGPNGSEPEAEVPF